MSDPLIRAPQVASIFERLRARGDAETLVHAAASTSAAALLALADQWRASLEHAGVKPGDVCSFAGDYDPHTVSLLLALVHAGAVATPFSVAALREREGLEQIAGARWRIDARTGGVTQVAARPRHPLLVQLAASGRPGLIVFTSGSTGAPKAILHDVERVAGKFATARRPWRMALMLLIDHFGGFNTLLGVLADGGVAICPQERSPEAVCAAVATHRIEALPTTPTFLAMLIVSEAWKRHDLSSLRLITYGAEPMPAATLKRIRELLPAVTLKQTYGLSEVGVLRTASPDPASLWLRVGGDGFETRIVDGQLHVRSQSSMLGYLNAPSPIDADGWMNTGDLVEERDGLIRFLGRETDVVNVGGQKVFPAEVEGVLLEAPGVVEASVRGAPHPILGQAVVACVALDGPAANDAAARLREHCRTRLQKYKVPMRFEFVEMSELVTERAKKRRAP